MGASSVSGNPITYTISSGPATVSGNQVTLTKSAGEVRVRATAAATSLLYSSTRDIQFTVVDLSTYLPIVTTRLIEDFPVEVVDTSCFYPIYINAKIEEPSFLSISKVSLNIDGHEVNAIQKNGFYYFGWQPKELKRYNIEITAHGSNGKTTTITRNIEVKDKATAQTVTGFKDAIIQYGTTNSRDFYGTYKFPQHVGVYKQLYAKLEVECPNGNCDDWDRWAYIDIKAPDGNWIQIIRYITPYNVACNHEIDLSDYASLLQGEVEMHIFIDTWGTGGWQLTLDVDYILGKPTYKYSVVDEVWDGAYDFGNPQNLQPVPDRTLVLHDATAAMKLSLSTTGHGWGANNTGNAAEFYHAKHDIMWAGTRIYEQDLWRKCNPNPDNCTGQQGTWQYDRAGWCPGAISPPDFFDFDNYVESGTATLGYKFQASYKDECHPNNPACQSGVTCADCNAGSNPQYFVDGHLISYSNEGLVYGDPSNLLNTQEHSLGEEEVVLHVFPNPSKGRFKLSVSSFEGSAHLAIFSVDGVQHRRFFVESDRDLENQELNLENLPSGIYFIELVVNTGNRVSQKLVLEK